MKVIDILKKELLNENKGTTLKIMYSIKAKVLRKKEEEENKAGEIPLNTVPLNPEPQAPEAPAAFDPTAPIDPNTLQPTEAPATETPAAFDPTTPIDPNTLQPKTESVIYEVEDSYDEDKEYRADIKGELIIPQNDAENIQTLEDIVDFLSDKKDSKNNNIVDDVILNVLQISSGTSDGTKALGQVIGKDDKLIVDINYGPEITDSIGLKINKLSGSDSLTISLMKDGKILPGKFSVNNFNRFVVEVYRNSVVE
jgi:hypothetical protein